MLAKTDILYNILQELTILIPALLHGSLLSILLQSPYSPKQYVGVLHFINLALTGTLVNKIVDSLSSGLHSRLELIHLTHSKGQTRKRHEHVTCTAFEPRITSQDIVTVALQVVELVSSNNHTILEGIARRTNLILMLKHLLQLA